MCNDYYLVGIPGEHPETPQNVDLIDWMSTRDALAKLESLIS